MISEEELTQQLNKSKARLEEIRLNIRDLKTLLSDQETEFIGAQLEIRQLNEALRVLKLRLGQD